MKKLLSKKGFTLMEMLIVVAIIVILVAISIPAFSGSLEKANKATDMSNLRSAQAAAVVNIISGDFEAVGAPGYWYYDIAEGKFKGTNDTSTIPSTALGSCAKHTTKHIYYNKTTQTVQWSVDDSTDCE